MAFIFCFGDSITYGEGDTQHGGWAERLKQRLSQSHLSDKTLSACYNLGIGSETTDGLMQRFANEFKVRRLKDQYNLIIFAYGTNDIAVKKGKNTVPIQYYLRNIKHCIDIAKTTRTDFMILSICPIADEIDNQTNRYGKWLRQNDIIVYNQALKQFCQQEDLAYVDLYQAFMQQPEVMLLCSDGIHPNVQGHALIYQVILQHPLITSILQQTES